MMHAFAPTALLLAIAATTGCTQRLGQSDAALALEDISAGYESSRLKRRTPAPERRPVEYEIAERRYHGDTYVSPEGTLAGIMLVPGVVAKGKDDPRLVALAQTLARMRFAVFVPDMKGLRQLRVRVSDVREVADGFRYLASRTDLAPSGRAGIAGFSYGAGPVMLAALEKDIRDRVDFILALGGFHDAQHTITYFTTGYFRDETTGKWRHLEQNLYGVWVFARSYVELATRAEDRKRLTRYFEELAAERQFSKMRMLPGLAPDAQALQTLLMNRDPERVPALVAQLSPSMRREMEGLNPATRDLRQLEAQMILIHGRGDNIIPFTESIALVKALAPEQVELFLIDGLAHVELKLMRQDVPILLRAMESLLARRANE